MCGIAGIYKSALSPDLTKAVVQKMTDALFHRGPDGEGHFQLEDVALGHRRLAILDPSEKGVQPMQRNDLVITYNGELYNYQSEKDRLKKKGHSFKTETDTEVILALYEEHGLDFVHRLNGIFALAIYDKKKKQLICVRDPYGIKPFLFSKINQTYIFASELKGLLASGLIERKINQVSLGALLFKGSIAQPMSAIKGVEWLKPGHMMILENDQTRTIDYFQFEKAHQKRESSNDILKEFEHEMTQSVHEQMVSDVPLGAFLSGGVDSSLIVALMKKKQEDIKTFSVGFQSEHFHEQYSEVSDARAVANFLKTDHQEVIVKDQEIKGLLRLFVKGLDHPSIDGLNSFFVSRAAAQMLRVSLSGTGADEILGGYSWFQTMRQDPKRSFKRKLIDGITGQDFQSRYNKLHHVFPKNQISLLRQGKIQFRKCELQDPFPEAEIIKRVSGMVIKGYLQNQLLADIDTTSMFNSLEVRVPYLKPSLVNLALNLPEQLKLSGGDPQFAKESYAGSGVKAIMAYVGKKYLPPDFFQRQKRGFGLPMKSWLKTIWRSELENSLVAETVKKRGLFDPQEVQNILKGFFADKIPWTQVWLLMVIELWCQEVLDEK